MPNKLTFPVHHKIHSGMCVNARNDALLRNWCFVVNSSGHRSEENNQEHYGVLEDLLNDEHEEMLILGLGDMVVPGLLLCLAARLDVVRNKRKSQYVCLNGTCVVTHFKQRVRGALRCWCFRRRLRSRRWSTRTGATTSNMLRIELSQHLCGWIRRGARSYVYGRHAVGFRAGANLVQCYSGWLSILCALPCSLPLFTWCRVHSSL
jgi:hypothetical protein